MNLSEREWFRRNHGKIFHPLEVVGMLSQFYEHPAEKYSFLEDAGHLVPASFRNGKIDSVRLYFPRYESLSEIEEESGLSMGTLARMLEPVFICGSIRANALRLNNGVLKQLIDNRHLIVEGNMVRLGKEGHHYFGSRN